MCYVGLLIVFDGIRHWFYFLWVFNIFVLRWRLMNGRRNMWSRKDKIYVFQRYAQLQNNYGLKCAFYVFRKIFILYTTAEMQKSKLILIFQIGFSLFVNS